MLLAMFSEDLKAVLMMLFVIIILVCFIVFENTNKKNKINKTNKVYNIFSYICLVIVILSYIFNFGMIRGIILIEGFPILILIMHYIMFFRFNKYYSNFSKQNKMLDYVNKFVYITYILFWAFLPDGSLYGPATAFWGIVKFNFNNDTDSIICNIFFIVSFLSIIINIVLLIIQYTATSKIEKKFELEQNTE